MSECNILIDRLKSGQTERIDEHLNAEFLGPDEAELKFGSVVDVKGEAYLTDDHLIIHLKAATKFTMPCSICNQMTETDLKIDHFYQAVPIEEIPSAVFNYQDLLRESLLIELPGTIECNAGKCPEREIIETYMGSKEKTNLPFADLDKN